MRKLEARPKALLAGFSTGIMFAGTLAGIRPGQTPGSRSSQ